MKTYELLLYVVFTQMLIDVVLRVWLARKSYIAVPDEDFRTSIAAANVYRYSSECRVRAYSRS